MLEVGHERAHFEARLSVASKCAWLETSAGEDAVVLIERRALRPERAARPPSPSAPRRLRRKSRMLVLSQPLAAARRQARPRQRQRHPPARRESRPGRPQRRRQVVAVLAARRPALQSDAGDFAMPPRWRIGEVAQEMPETDEAATDFVLDGDRAGRGLAAARRGPSRATTARHGRGPRGDRRGRRLRRAAARAGDAARPRLPHRRARRAGGELLRRLAHAAAAGARADVPGRPAAARRADQPPRPRRAGVARGLAAALRRHDGRHQPRPRVPRRGDQGDAAPRRVEPDPLQRQLHPVRGDARDPDRAAGQLREAAGAHRAPAEVHRPLQGQGEQGQAGAEPRQGAGAHGAPRAGADRRRLPVRVPRARACRTRCSPSTAWPAASTPRRDADRRLHRPLGAGRPAHRHPRRQRPGQVDLREDDRRRTRAARRRVVEGKGLRSATSRSRSSTCSRPPTAR